MVGNTNGLGVIANGTYVQYVTSQTTAGSALQIASNPTFTGSIDDVSLMEVTAEDGIRDVERSRGSEMCIRDSCGRVVLCAAGALDPKPSSSSFPSKPSQQ